MLWDAIFGRIPWGRWGPYRYGPIERFCTVYASTSDESVVVPTIHGTMVEDRNCYCTED